MNQTAACLNLSVRCWSTKCCSSAWRRSFLIVLTSPTAYVRPVYVIPAFSRTRATDCRRRTRATSCLARVVPNTGADAQCNKLAKVVGRTNLIRSLSANIHTYYYRYSITHSLFHSRLKTSLFCKSFPPQPFLFFFRIHYKDSPDCLLLLLSIFRLLLFSFSVFTLFSYRFRAVD